MTIPPTQGFRQLIQTLQITLTDVGVLRGIGMEMEMEMIAVRTVYGV